MPAAIAAPLTPAEEAAWRSLARTIVMLRRALDADLLRRAGLSMTHYTALMRLSEAPDRTLRMSDLAAGSDVSPSRMTRVVAAMVDQGLICRRTDPGDARVALATLTDAGLDRLREAWPEHLAGVRDLVVDRLTARDLSDLRRICDRLAVDVGCPESS